MKTWCGIAFACVLQTAATAADFPEWAYPVNPPAVKPNNVVQKHLPGTSKTYTQAQIDDDFNVPDWYPDDHPPMPKVVANGRLPAVRACAKCHLTSGNGHPESSSIVGLHVTYFIKQMAEFKNGNRKGARSTAMLPIAKAISDEEVAAAAEYFASLKPTPWIRVVETETVPKTFLGQGAMRFPSPGGETEPIGNRIIELPENDHQAESRDPRSGFVAHVPKGSVAKGELLVTTGAGGKTIACAICHGPNLKGLADLPGIAGRSPMYVYRQLNDMKVGTRTGSQTELMKAVVAQLSDTDMLEIAAYLATRPQ